MIKRDLAVGSEVEITLRINESRLITVEAYVTALDEEFEPQFDLRKKAISSSVIDDDCRKGDETSSLSPE